MNPTDVMRALVNARAAIDNALVLLTVTEPEAPAVIAPEPGQPCTHPPAKRKPAPVGGDLNQFLCNACHTLVSGTVADGA